MAYQASRAFTNAVAVTTSDTTRQAAMGFYVGGTGDVAVMPLHQEDAATPTAVTFKACPVGFVLRDFAISRFMATNTTATLIIALGYGGI